MKKFSIVTTVYGTYELLRQLAESVITHIDKDCLDKLIIVDDFSSREGKLHDYYDYLEATYDYIKVVRFPQYRPNIYESRLKRVMNNSRSYDSMKCNLGPALAVQVGIEAVESELVLVVDSDTIFLKKSNGLLGELVTHFYNHPQVMCIGQVLGLNSHVDYKFDRLYYSLLGNNYRNGTCGEVSPIAYACRMSGWEVNQIEQISYGPAIIAWNNTLYMMSIYQECQKTMNFPIFSKGYMVHIGGSTVRKLFGYTKDFAIYGGRAGDRIRDYYCGRYAINMTVKEYKGTLAEIGNRPFERVVTINEEKGLFVLPLYEAQKYKGFPTVEYHEHFFDPEHKFYRTPMVDRTSEEQNLFIETQRRKRVNYLEKVGEHTR